MTRQVELKPEKTQNLAAASAIKIARLPLRLYTVQYKQEKNKKNCVLVLPDLLPPEEVEVLCCGGGLHHLPVHVVPVSTAQHSGYQLSFFTLYSKVPYRN